jgi:NAD(P)H-flavin reductase
LYEAKDTEAARHEGRQIWLLFGARYQRDLYYKDEFLKLAAEQPNFHYVPTLSRGDDDWSGKRGYVQEHVREIVRDRKDMTAYICGLDRMVSANRELLKSLGWDRKSIRYEKYD